MSVGQHVLFMDATVSVSTLKKKKKKSKPEWKQGLIIISGKTK